MDVSSTWMRWKKWIIAGTVVILLYTLVGFFGLPAIVGSVLPDKLGAALKREVSLGKVRVNPYALSVTLEDLRVSAPDGSPFAGFQRLYANLQLSSLVRWAVVLREVRLEGFDGTVVRTGERRFNFSDLLPEGETKPPADDSEAKGPFRFAVHRLLVTGARISFDDRFTGSRHRLEGLDLKAADLSSLPAGTGREVTADLSATADGASVSVSARARPFAADRSASADITVENLSLPRYRVYLPVKPAAVVESALLGLSLRVEFTRPEEGPETLVLSGPVRLSKVKILDRSKQTLLQVPETAVRLGKSDLLAKAVTLEDVRITRPETRIVRGRDGVLNLLDLVPPVTAPEGGDEAQGRPDAGAPGVSLKVNQAAVSGGTVRFVDEAVAGGFETTLSGIDASVDGFSLEPENRSVYRLSLTTDADESITAEGGFSLFPVRADGSFAVGEIDLARYMPYAADRLNVQINGGRLSLGGRFSVAAGGPSPEVELEEGKAALRSLVLYQPEDQEPVVSIPALDVSGVAFSTAGRRLSVGEVASEKGEAFFLRRGDGSINLGELVAVPEGGGAPPDADRTGSVGKAAGAPGEPSSSIQFSIERIRIKDYRLRFEDRQPSETVSSTLSDIRIEVDGLSNTAGSTATVALGCAGDRGGTGSLNGTFGINPLVADLKVDVKKIDIRAFQPYFTDRVRIIVTGGTASADGRFRFDAAGSGTPKITYSGRAEINGFKSVDKEDTLEFIDWESLFFSKVDVGFPPVSVSVEEVGLTGLYSRFIIDPDGTINVIDAVSGGPGEAPAAAPGEIAGGATRTQTGGGNAAPEPKKPDAAAPSIRIGTVTLQNGHVNFTDLFNPFNFKGDLSKIGGRVSGLSSMETDRADVLLSGSWENRAPLEIKGKINPLAEARYADVTLTIRDIDLSPFSPYSGKFLGYKLEKGLLTLQLGYLLEGAHLKGDNRAYFEGLTLGDRVDSDDATSLPVSLAISLLKDPSGAITLDVPVEGNLNDPQFSLGRTIMRVIGNLLVKIVSSPFAFLGSLVGGEEELSFIDFEAGSTAITPAAEEKIDALTTALSERPALELEIRGDADPKADPEALRRKRFEELIRSQKLRDLTRRGETAVPIEEIEITPEEYPRYLKKAYDAADFPKPRDADGKIKELPPEEMEKLLLTQFVFTENDLRQLAVERADVVKSRMLETGRVGSDRLFIVEPKISTGAGVKETEDAGKSQVRFSLR